jgi:hypothetical protein
MARQRGLGLLPTHRSKNHACHKGGGFMSSFAENGLTKVDSAAERMANARVEASVNIRNGMVGGIGDGMREASVKIRNGMIAAGVCIVVSSLLGRGPGK